MCYLRLTSRLGLSSWPARYPHRQEMSPCGRFVYQDMSFPCINSLSREQLIGIGTGEKNPEAWSRGFFSPSGRAPSLSSRPVSWGVTRRGVLRYSLHALETFPRPSGVPCLPSPSPQSHRLSSGSSTVHEPRMTLKFLWVMIN